MPPGYAGSVRPKRDIDRLQDEIQELFADLWQVPRIAGTRRAHRPQVDCYQNGDPPELTVIVELPGVEPGDVHLVAVGRTLIVSGERRRARCEGRVYNRMEIEYGPFYRELALPEDIDSAAARARYDRGLLTVVLPVAPQRPAQERVSIEVTTR
jgi:HSP20 family protein